MRYLARHRSDGLSTCAQVTMSLVLGLAVFALLANARDIGKYIKLKAM